MVSPVCLICGIFIPDGEGIVLPPYSTGQHDVTICAKCNVEEMPGGE